MLRRDLSLFVLKTSNSTIWYGFDILLGIAGTSERQLPMPRQYLGAELRPFGGRQKTNVQHFGHMYVKLQFCVDNLFQTQLRLRDCCCTIDLSVCQRRAALPRDPAWPCVCDSSNYLLLSWKE